MDPNGDPIDSFTLKTFYGSTEEITCHQENADELQENGLTTLAFTEPGFYEVNFGAENNIGELSPLTMITVVVIDPSLEEQVKSIGVQILSANDCWSTSGPYDVKGEFSFPDPDSRHTIEFNWYSFRYDEWTLWSTEEYPTIELESGVMNICLDVISEDGSYGTACTSFYVVPEEATSDEQGTGQPAHLSMSSLKKQPQMNRRRAHPL